MSEAPLDAQLLAQPDTCRLASEGWIAALSVRAKSRVSPQAALQAGAPGQATTRSSGSRGSTNKPFSRAAAASCALSAARAPNSSTLRVGATRSVPSPNCSQSEAMACQCSASAEPNGTPMPNQLRSAG